MRARSVLVGLGALAAITGVVVGVPAVLVLAVGNPWPGRMAVELGDQAELVVGLLAVLAWVIWARFVVAVGVEVARQWPRHDEPESSVGVLGIARPSDPSRRGVGALAGSLVAAVLAILPIATVPSVAVGGGPLPPRPAVVPATALPLTPGPASWLPRPPTPSAGAAVTVQRGDTLYGLARTHLGDATRWREIFELNDDVLQPDGGRLASPSLIQPGWRLTLPTTPPTRGPDSTPVAEAPADGVHVVEAGESYWSIAEDELMGSGSEAGDAEVLDQVGRLIDLNAPRLGHADPRMLHTGDEVDLAPLAADGEPSVEAVGVAEVDGDLAEAAAADVVDASMPPTIPVPVPVPVPSVGDSPVPVTATSPGSVPSAIVEAPPSTLPSTVSTSTSSPTAAIPDAGFGDSDGSPWRGIGAAVLMSAGVYGLVQARRRSALRSAPKGARLRAPGEREAQTLRALGGASPALLMARLDVAVRAGAPALAADNAALRWLTLAADGTIWLRPTAPTTPEPPWRIDLDSDEWVLPASVDIVELADRARGVAFPCPTLVALGRTARGELFVDLEQIGVLVVDDADRAADISRQIVASLAVSPFAMGVSLLTVGVEEAAHLDCVAAEAVDDVGAALGRAVACSSSTAAEIDGVDSTFALRVRSDGETWDPTVLVASGVELDARQSAELVARARPGHGLAAFVGHPLDGAGATLRRLGLGWALDPFGIEVIVAGLSEEAIEAVAEVVVAASEPLIPEPIPFSGGAGDRRPATAGTFVEPEWALLVQTLGHVGVVTADGAAVPFERSKALELVVWLGLHRRHATRVRARTALWEIDVRDNTFLNVVSDARRAMARSVEPPAGEQWIGRKANDQLPLHPLVITDVDLLSARLDAARGCPAHEAIDLLRPGVELIWGMPFADTAYTWVDTEGLGSALALLVTTATTELAGWFLQVGDIEGVFWATGCGLKVIPGHEELIALRMRAHADQGDMAGVRNEWAAYERALNADLWAGECEPSPKLVALRRKLLSAQGGERAS
jgi:LysM repeat protein